MEFLSSLITPVVEKLRDFLIGRVLQTIRVGDIVAELDHQVDILKQKRQDVEATIERDEPAGKVATNVVKGWLQNVEALEKEAATISNKYKERNCRVLGNCSFNCRSSHSISVEAVDVKTKVEDELQRIEHIQCTEYPPPPRVQEVPTIALGSDTGSEIRSKVDIALNFLRNDNEAVLGIWGMGGVGKTTILQHINNTLAMVNDASLGFHRVVFVTASRGCTVEKIQKQVAKELKLPEDGDLKTNIFNFLQNRSFVILLDDLWEPLDLKQVGVPPLGVVGELKRKLILATRNHQVCFDMDAHAHHTVRVDCLTPDNAHRLFREKVGEEVIKSHPLISDLADKIADECGGLPVALIVIARAMAGKPRPDLWEKALNDLHASKMISGKTDDPLSLLKVSYDYLENPEWQKCLLHCALWPEDFEIHEDDLIECWMGHSLLGDFKNMKEAYDNGYEIINSLHKASLLEYSEDEDLRGVVRLHDLIRDMALWIARDSCGENGKKWVVLSGVNVFEALGDKMLWRESHKISLMKSPYRGRLSRLPPDISAPNLVTLVLQFIELKSEGLGSIQNFHNLTYLDLSINNLEGFPIEICRLYKLEYLNLSNNSIRRLPGKLKDLKRLKYLLLRDADISKAPSELFSSMDSLEVLDLSSLSTLLHFSKVSQSFIKNKNLDGLKGRLKGLGIHACSQLDLDKLNELSMPITRLMIRFTERKRGPSVDLLPRPKHPRDPTWSSIKYLVVQGEHRGGIEELVIHEDYGCFPKDLTLKYHRNLKEIVWKGVKDRDAASLNRLTSVTIHGCYKIKHLSWLLNLPLLAVLVVGGCEGMEHVIWEEEASEIEHEYHVPSQLPSATFPALRHLKLRDLRELKSICNRAISLPCLENLQVFGCPSLKKLPFDTPASCSKLKKIEAKKEWWEDTLELDGDMRTHLQSRFVESASIEYYNKFYNW